MKTFRYHVVISKKDPGKVVEFPNPVHVGEFIYYRTPSGSCTEYRVKRVVHETTIMGADETFLCVKRAS